MADHCKPGEHDLRDDVMYEEGIEHPVKVCNKCGWWF